MAATVTEHYAACLATKPILLTQSKHNGPKHTKSRKRKMITEVPEIHGYCTHIHQTAAPTHTVFCANIRMVFSLQLPSRFDPYVIHGKYHAQIINDLWMILFNL